MYARSATWVGWWDGLYVVLIRWALCAGASLIWSADLFRTMAGNTLSLLALLLACAAGAPAAQSASEFDVHTEQAAGEGGLPAGSNTGEETDDPNDGDAHVENGPVAVTLTVAENAQFLSAINSKMNDFTAECGGTAGASQPYFKATTIGSPVLQRVSGQGWEYTLPVLAAQGSPAIGVNIIQYRDDDHLEVIDLEPRSIMPACARQRFALEDSLASTATDPSTPEEQAEFAREQGAEFVAAQRSLRVDAIAFPEMKNAVLKTENPSTILSTLKWYREHSHKLQTAEEAHKHRTYTYLVAPLHEAQVSASAPANYNAFGNNDCLSRMPARRQSCMDCTTFAAATAFTLNYCLAMARSGSSTANAPVMSPQDLISCGSRGATDPRSNQNYFSPQGLQTGWSNINVARYTLDYGLASTGCWPYAQSGRCQQATPCRNSCVSSSSHTFTRHRARGNTNPVSQHQTVMRFGTEANVMAAMARYGALTCSFNVHASFNQQLRDGTLAAGGVYMGRTASDTGEGGGHAVACFGWGALSDGTKYWQCINSWGANSGHMDVPGGQVMFRMVRRAGEMHSQNSSGLLACGLALGVQSGTNNLNCEERASGPSGWRWRRGSTSCGWAGTGRGPSYSVEPCTCSVMASMGLCTHSNYGTQFTNMCPVSCGICSAFPSSFVAGLSPSPPPGPDPTIDYPPPPSPPPNPPYVGICAEAPNAGSGWSWSNSIVSCGGSGEPACTCDQLANGFQLCNHAGHGASIRRDCPVSCGVCSLSGSGYQGNCAEPTSAGNPGNWGWRSGSSSCGWRPGQTTCTCPLLASMRACTNRPNGPTIINMCPVSCGACTPGALTAKAEEKNALLPPQ